MHDHKYNDYRWWLNPSIPNKTRTCSKPNTCSFWCIVLYVCLSVCVYFSHSLNICFTHYVSLKLIYFCLFYLHFSPLFPLFSCSPLFLSLPLAHLYTSHLLANLFSSNFSPFSLSSLPPFHLLIPSSDPKKKKKKKKWTQKNS